MKLLLDDSFAPITSEVGFLECDADVAASAFLEWQKTIQAKRGVELKQNTIQGKLPKLLSSLLPLTSIECRKTLFLPTNSRWTAYFDNGWQGGDPASVVSFLSEEVGCNGVRAVCVPHTRNSEIGQDTGRYGGTMFELYSPQRTDFLNTVRSVYTVFDGGRWVFGANGEPQIYEDLDKYKKKNIVDRFTPGMLSDYLRALEIDAFSEGFYSSSQDSYMIYKVGPTAENMKEYSLSEARAKF